MNVLLGRHVKALWQGQIEQVYETVVLAPAGWPESHCSFLAGVLNAEDAKACQKTALRLGQIVRLFQVALSHFNKLPRVFMLVSMIVLCRAQVHMHLRYLVGAYFFAHM